MGHFCRIGENQHYETFCRPGASHSNIYYQKLQTTTDIFWVTNTNTLIIFILPFNCNRPFSNNLANISKLL